MKPILRAPSTSLAPVAAAALAALALAACGSAASPGAGTSGGSTVVGGSMPAPSGSASGGSGPATGTSGDARLVATVAPGSPAKGGGIKAEPGVVVEYTLTNTGSAPLAADDVVPASLGSASLPADVDREHAWVYAHEGTVRVSKQGFATAPNVRFAAAPMIGARTVPAGGTLTGRAFVPTPLTLAVPGADFTAPNDPLPAAAGSFSFCVQVGPAGSPMRPSAAGQGVLETPVAAPTADTLVCTDPLQVPVS